MNFSNMIAAYNFEAWLGLAVTLILTLSVLCAVAMIAGVALRRFKGRSPKKDSVMKFKNCRFVYYAALFMVFFVSSASAEPNYGSSKALCSPAISGDLTTGFYTAGAGKIDVSISNTQVGEWTSTGYAQVVGSFTIPSATFYVFLSRSKIGSAADGDLTLLNNGGTDFGSLKFGGTTSSFPALKRSTTSLAVRLADDSADAPVTASNVTASGAFNATSAQTTVNCSTSGTAIFSQPFQGSSYRRAAVYMSACLGTASYTFPTAFTNTPAILTTNGPASSIVTSLSTSAMTVTGATTTGYEIVEGY